MKIAVRRMPPHKNNSLAASFVHIAFASIVIITKIICDKSMR
jgi:hypothetical protein|nr:MAG TPA: hypothetical protein [Caudoviricetes sp.]